jgi:dTDP-glucose 4,6-dehydratase
MKTYLVTGGAGFIGSNFVIKCRREWNIKVVNVDKLTYAGTLKNLESLAHDSNHLFVQGDICDQDLLKELLAVHQPDALINFAAESHVDRSIIVPELFVQTNIHGTFCLLESCRDYLKNEGKPENFRFLHISTDEVFGALGRDDPAFIEETPYRPNSPYSASKAAADHLVRAYYHTYGLPTLITNCSNNYGPRQFPEKLIPLMILNAVEGKELPIYGDGSNIRDWLFVEDHCDAIQAVLKNGRPGETYNIGGNCEKSNNETVYKICEILDDLRQVSINTQHRNQICYVQDRPGHDRRYAINSNKIRSELGWLPKETFETGLSRTIQWYIDNPEWVEFINTGEYAAWMKKNYHSRKSTMQSFVISKQD